jgi:hypothetical protein
MSNAVFQPSAYCNGLCLAAITKAKQKKQNTTGFEHTTV